MIIYWPTTSHWNPQVGTSWGLPYENQHHLMFTSKEAVDEYGITIQHYECNNCHVLYNYHEVEYHTLQLCKDNIGDYRQRMKENEIWAREEVRKRRGIRFRR